MGSMISITPLLWVVSAKFRHLQHRGQYTRTIRTPPSFLWLPNTFLVNVGPYDRGNRLPTLPMASPPVEGEKFALLHEPGVCLALAKGLIPENVSKHPLFAQLGPKHVLVLSLVGCIQHEPLRGTQSVDDRLSVSWVSHARHIEMLASPSGTQGRIVKSFHPELLHKCVQVNQRTLRESLWELTFAIATNLVLKSKFQGSDISKLRSAVLRAMAVCGKSLGGSKSPKYVQSLGLWRKPLAKATFFNRDIHTITLVFNELILTCIEIISAYLGF